MEIKLNKYPSFLNTGARVLSEKGSDSISDLTVTEYINIHKMALYEVLSELQAPPEQTRLFYTRNERLLPVWVLALLNFTGLNQVER